MIHHETRTRLTLTYLSIIMVLSLGFSFIFYRESTRAAGFGLKRQATQFRDNISVFPFQDELDRVRDAEIERFRNDLSLRLLALNIGMLVAGAFISSYLARRSLEPMEEAIEAQSRFTSDAAHELRTPLTAMKTEIEVSLRSKKLASEEVKEVLRSSLEEIGKLESLTGALLRLAKNSHQPDPDSWKKVKISSVISSAVDRVRPEAEKQSVTFDVPATSKLSVPGDHDQLVELFVVLLDNAVKYGKPSSSVMITLLEEDDNAVISVSDQGIGISEEDLPRVFERFYRADQSRTKSKVTGYGLGLSVAEAIVKTHSGTIEATSEPGTGTTFIVALPRS